MSDNVIRVNFNKAKDPYDDGSAPVHQCVVTITWQEPVWWAWLFRRRRVVGSPRRQT